jgi:HAD superfamily hydrolase (TIGR01509 family)
MIRAMIFDLDGTLVQTEKLKALSYAKAAVELCPRQICEQDVLEAFKRVVGLPRSQVAKALVDQFDLEGPAKDRMQEFGVTVPWQEFVQVRLLHYGKMLDDPQVIRDNQWPHNRAVLEQAQRTGCKTGLATMSHCEQAARVLSILGLAEAFDFVATHDDVEHGKPDSEIYLLVSSEIEVAPKDCLVLEDSPSGIKAALAAGMNCIAVTTPFTRESVHALDLLPEEWIVDDPSKVVEVVRQRVAALNQ